MSGYELIERCVNGDQECENCRWQTECIEYQKRFGCFPWEMEEKLNEELKDGRKRK